jgi:hypothetical protein
LISFTDTFFTLKPTEKRGRKHTDTADGMSMERLQHTTGGHRWNCRRLHVNVCSYHCHL